MCFVSCYSYLCTVMGGLVRNKGKHSLWRPFHILKCRRVQNTTDTCQKCCNSGRVRMSLHGRLSSHCICLSYTKYITSLLLNIRLCWWYFRFLYVYTFVHNSKKYEMQATLIRSLIKYSSISLPQLDVQESGLLPPVLLSIRIYYYIYCFIVIRIVAYPQHACYNIAKFNNVSSIAILCNIVVPLLQYCVIL